jgi:hypothetical protein
VVWALPLAARNVEQSRIVMAEERVVATLAEPGAGSASACASARLDKRTSTAEGLPIGPPAGGRGRKTPGSEVWRAVEADDGGIGEPLTQNPRRNAGPVATKG